MKRARKLDPEEAYRLHIQEGLTYPQIAERFGVTKFRVRNAIYDWRDEQKAAGVEVPPLAPPKKKRETDDRYVPHIQHAGSCVNGYPHHWVLDHTNHGICKGCGAEKTFVPRLKVDAARGVA